MTDYEISSCAPEVILDRARWLGELAYANGDSVMQSGWAEYVKEERGRIETVNPGAKIEAYSKFKELSCNKL